MAHMDNETPPRAETPLMSAMISGTSAGVTTSDMLKSGKMFHFVANIGQRSIGNAVLCLGLIGISAVRMNARRLAHIEPDIRMQLTYYVVYQLYFHPLAKYPGPFLGKLTDWRAGYFSWTGDLHIDMWRCHQKYGEFARSQSDVFQS